MLFQVYRARRGLLLRPQWRWRLKADNGRIIATSGESYNNRGDALHGANLVRQEAMYAPIEGMD